MTDDTLSHDDDAYELPCVEAMLAGSLALMTGHAESGCERHRSLMARKICSNLFFLAQHPGVNGPFRTVLQRLHVHWGQLARANPVGSAESPARPTETAVLLPETRLWHPLVETVQ